MSEANVNNRKYEIELSEDSIFTGKIDSDNFSFSIKSQNKNNYIIEKDGIEYDLDIIDLNENTKTIEILVNGKYFKTNLRDQYDKLIHNLGYGRKNDSESRYIKAPMPGLVLDILIKKNDPIKEGQHLLVLEAMKMENIIKSNSVGKIKNVNISKNDTVDKDEILIELE
ncbi:MAG: acetyl-CoA carboxylase biotin carboxyl carrier protein subunit [Bacteroidota bacterium]